MGAPRGAEIPVLPARKNYVSRLVCVSLGSRFGLRSSRVSKCLAQKSRFEIRPKVAISIFGQNRLSRFRVEIAIPDLTQKRFVHKT